MILWFKVFFFVVAVQCIGLKCKERLDVINRSAWSTLPVSYLGTNLVNETELVAVGYFHGSTHSVLHTKNKETYLRGRSNNLQLYGSDMTRELVEIRGRRVTDVKFGDSLIAILTADGTVWTAGLNNNRQLGHHGRQNRPIFSPVQSLPPVVQVAVGWYHIVARTEDGELFSWGLNDHQQLGHGTSSATPVKFSLGNGDVIPKQICCGWRMCAALTLNLSVYTWGYSSHLGRPRGIGTPGLVQGIPTNQTITKLSCGLEHTVVLTKSGDLYGWGGNYYGEQIGVPAKVPRATKLNLGERIVRDVVAGDYLTIIRTYASVGEYFGRQGRNNYRTPQLATTLMYVRDVMTRSGSGRGQVTSGVVKVGCETN